MKHVLRFILGSLAVVCAFGFGSGCSKLHSTVIGETQSAVSASTLLVPNGTAALALRNSSDDLFWPSAHRGDTKQAPSNSVSAIRSAVKLGIPLIEIDLRRSKDGKLFLRHDRTLDADTVIGPPEAIGSRIEYLNSDVVKKLRRREDGERFASFHDALNAIKGSTASFQIDPKGVDVVVIDQVIHEARAVGQVKQLVIQCYDLLSLLHVHEGYSDVAILARQKTPRRLKLMSDFAQVSFKLMPRGSRLK